MSSNSDSSLVPTATYTTVSVMSVPLHSNSLLCLPLYRHCSLVVTSTPGFVSTTVTLPAVSSATYVGDAAAASAATTSASAGVSTSGSALEEGTSVRFVFAAVAGAVAFLL